MPGSAGTNGFGLTSNGSGTFSFVPMQTGSNAVSSADYTVLDTDGYRELLVTTGASNRTMTLPTLADNIGRRIFVQKVDTGAGTVIIDGEGSETINGATTYTLYTQYEGVYLEAASSEWKVVSAYRSSPQMLSNAESTRLGQKAYFHGTTYNGGNAPTITLSSGGGTLSSVIRGEFIPYQMQDGTWRLRFNAGVSLSSTARTGATIAVAGVTFKNTSNFFQTISGMSLQSAVTTRAYVNPNADTISVEMASHTNTGAFYSGDVELESKPNWSY